MAAARGAAHLRGAWPASSGCAWSASASSRSGSPAASRPSARTCRGSSSMLAPLGRRHRDDDATACGCRSWRTTSPQAGLRRINVSLDSLRREVFLALTRRDELDRVLAGIDAAARRRPRPGEGQLRRHAGRQRRRGRRPRRASAATGRRRPLHRVHAPRRRRRVEPRQGRARARDPRAHRRGVPARAPAGRGSPSQRARRARRALRVRRRHRRRRRDRQRDRAVLRATATASGSPPRASSAPVCSRSTSTDLRAVLRGGGPRRRRSRRPPRRRDRGPVGTKWAGHRIGQVDFVRPDRSMSQIGG